MPSIFEKYHLKQVINTSGRMTALGVSTPRPEVVEAAMAGMNQYFEMKDLVNKTGEYIAKLLDVEGATVVSCASAGIAQSVAAVLVIGKTQYVEWVKRQSMGIGRAMKVGKEGILGLTCAIEHYLTASKESGEQMVAKMTPFIEQLNALNGVTARVVWDSAGRDIARAEIKFDEVTTGVKTGDLVNALKQGEYAIYFRGYKANEGIIEADVRSVNAQQLEVVARRIAEVLNKEKQA
ncbi:TPA: SelA-like pyridoxal phosphate-dependent enzyme [Klebsiella pneumoniae]|nr:SelA-like pyridoxal phosphate-dependent enzyme [Klebsiella pneumoniae]HBQ7353509.1 SelA-like pyridoxal phosphate-dependent enzyme [Klebsiella pneumoniae]